MFNYKNAVKKFDICSKDIKTNMTAKVLYELILISNW